MAITLTQADIAALQSYRAFIQSYYIDGEDREGIIRPTHDNGTFIDGALCLKAGTGEPTIAIDAMMHKNEPAGIAAQIDIIERWQKGDRPKNGTILLTLGTPPTIIVDFLDNIITKAERGDTINNDDGHHTYDEHLGTLAEALYGQTHGKILDIHSTASSDEAMLLPYLPRNTAKQAMGFDKIDSPHSDEQIYITANAMVSDAVKKAVAGEFDDLFTEDMVYSIADAYGNSKHDLEGTARDMCEHISGMPVKHVLADFYHGVLNSSFNDVMINPILKMRRLDGVPTVLETGGPNLASSHHHIAVDCTRAYTHNILNWPKHIPSLPASHRRYFYTDSISVRRPSKRNSDHPTHQKESYLLLHDAKSIPEPLKNKVDIDWDTIKPGRLNSFSKIKKGDPIAIGEQSGKVIRAEKEGYIAITPASRIDAEYSDGTAVAAIASNKIDERDIFPAVTQSHTK